jgi:hypothetical protein
MFNEPYNQAPRPALAMRTLARWQPTVHACPSRPSFGRGRSKAVHNDNKGPPRSCKKKGNTMKAIHSLIHGAARFVFGLGIGLALTATYVIVSSKPDLLAPEATAEVVRLDPVIVTGSAEKFAELSGKETLPRRIAHVFGKGPQRV